MSKGLSSLLQFGLRWLNLKGLLPLSQNTKIPLDVPRSLLLKEELAPSLGWWWWGGAVPNPLLPACSQEASGFGDPSLPQPRPPLGRVLRAG